MQYAKAIGILVFITYLCFCHVVLAQTTTPEVITTGGDSYSQIFGKMDVTIGESITETFSANDIKLTQGFQQCNYYVISIEEEENEGFKVYPNPTIDELNIEWDINENVMIFLYDMKGKLLYNGIMQKISRISLANYATGAYLLRLDSEKKRKTVIIHKSK